MHRFLLRCATAFVTGVLFWLAGCDNAADLDLRVIAGEVAYVEAYLQAGGDPNVRARDGMPVFCVAVASRQYAIVEKFIDSGVDVNIAHDGDLSAITIAAWNGDVRMLEVLMATGGVNPVSPVHIWALKKAVASGDMSMLVFLLEHGFGTTQSLSVEESPLDAARRFGYDEMAGVLEDYSSSMRESTRP